MNLVIIQDRIVNLDNATGIEKYRPGDLHPLHWINNSCFSKHTIWIEFNTVEGSRQDLTSAVKVFEYKNEAESNRDWQRLCGLARQT